MAVIWSQRMYVGEGAAEIKEQLCSDIESVQVLGYKKEYLVVLALNRQNLMEMLPVKDLAFSYYQEKRLHAVGLAADKAEATELVRRIVQDMAMEQGNMNVWQFFGLEGADGECAESAEKL